MVLIIVTKPGFKVQEDRRPWIILFTVYNSCSKIIIHNNLIKWQELLISVFPVLGLRSLEIRIGILSTYSCIGTMNV
jgi:hypothetical protein